MTAIKPSQSERFVKCPPALIRNRKVSAQAKLLWLAIAEYRFDPNSSCYPSITTLSTTLGISRRWTMNLIGELRAAGLLQSESRPGRSTLYHLVEPPLELVNPTSLVNSSSLVNPTSHTCEPQFTGGVNHSSPELDLLNRGTQEDIPPSAVPASADAPASPSPEKVSKKKAKSPKKEPDPRIKRLVDHFCSAHQEIIGDKCHVLGPKEAMAIKRLLGTFDEPEIKRRMLKYLRDPLSWMAKPMHSVTHFETRVGSYGRGSERGESLDRVDDLAGYAQEWGEC